jgi:hypothetical protein
VERKWQKVVRSKKNPNLGESRLQTLDIGVFATVRKLNNKGLNIKK